MKNFNTIIKETIAGLADPHIPKLKTPNLTSLGKRNSNDQSKIAGKYFKGNTNTNRSMISQRDRDAKSAKGQLKNKIDNIQNQTIVIDKDRFDKLLNTSGGRSLNLSDGKPKSINSKTAKYTAILLPDGRVKITKLPK